jgi:hypothetical protein
VDRPPYEAAVRFYSIAEVHWPTLDYTFKEVDLLSQPPSRFCNLIEGWVTERIANNSKPEEIETNIERWQFSMRERLPWQSVAKPKTSSIEADREAFLALDQIETH